MKNEFKEKVQVFYDITNLLIRSLKNDEYDGLEELLERRGKVIEAINSLSFDKTDFKIISDELGLIELEKMLNELLNENRQKVRSKIEKLNNAKKANSTYQKSFQADSIFFSKKI
jgi:hypothetical protein